MWVCTATHAQEFGDVTLSEDVGHELGYLLQALPEQHQQLLRVIDGTRVRL